MKTLFEGKRLSLKVDAVPTGHLFAELEFNAKEDSVNKFNQETLSELTSAVTALKAESNVKGLLLTSGKDVFIVGADIPEFVTKFKEPIDVLTKWLNEVNATFNAIEDLPYPTVACINGFALGGGFEVSLACSYRLATPEAKVGLPETKLGIIPGWGGTVRLPRLCGADTAIEWICGGEQMSTADALKAGAIDGIIAKEDLKAAAVKLLTESAQGTNNLYQTRQTDKKTPLKLNKTEAMMVFEGAKGFIIGKVGKNYPAPIAAIDAMRESCLKSREEALQNETKGFCNVARGPVAEALVGVFLSDQWIKKNAKKASKSALPVQSAAVLGAGIMGGGIAYQSASKGIPIQMKDIAPKALDLGLSEAAKILDKQVERGKMTRIKMAEIMGRIRSTLSFGDFANVDFVVEAVIENEGIKAKVLKETEEKIKPTTVLASNTSTISITKLAESLSRPEKFCGMHFFNPVHRMPLVEIIRGAKSSDETIATTVAYATAMGKTAIVVNDCAGFYVNRVLFPYLAGFFELLNDGADFQRIDKVMEKWGWPMGPAYLIDVVGIDTAVHADQVMAKAFPDRMAHGSESAIELMVKNQRLGQKNGKGFYKYEADKKGPPKKKVDPEAVALVGEFVKTKGRKALPEITDEDIVLRMMLPMLFESSRCLEDKIIGTPAEIDVCLMYGLGFPPFRGGICRWADQFGISKLVEASAKYASLGGLYQVTEQMKQMAKTGTGFYSN